MSTPIQIACLGRQPPDLSTSPWGPFVVLQVGSRDELLQVLDQQALQVAVIEADASSGLAALAAWPGLVRLVGACAVLVLAPEPSAADALKLIHQGVQDVLPMREANEAVLGRAVRLAQARHEVDRTARKAYATDLATGLPNQTQLMEHMTHLLALREREPAAMAVLALRIDGLEAIQARMGIEAVNVLRRKVAVRLRAGLRASDVVASVGADCFVVLLAWVDSAADGARVAQKLVRALHRPLTVAGQDVAVVVRVGVAEYPDHGKEASSLLSKALMLAGEAQGVGRSGQSAHGHTPAANDE